ncbi:MAG: hypothetical protein ABI409_21010, partial [Ramlibacter sp.]
MALQPPFFGKRDADTTGLRRPMTMAQPNVPASQNQATPQHNTSQSPVAVAVAPAATSSAAGPAAARWPPPGTDVH